MEARSRARNNGWMSRAKLGVLPCVVMIVLLSRLDELLFDDAEAPLYLLHLLPQMKRLSLNPPEKPNEYI
jgi:hypothetical protein